MERRWRVLTIFSWSLLALGLALQGYRYMRSTSEISRAGTPKTLEQYWQETGMDFSSISELIENETCQSSQRYFMACMNSVLSVAGHLGYELGEEGQLKPQEASRMALGTEKARLAPWKEFFTQKATQVKTIDFKSLFKQLSSMPMTEAKKSLLSGAGLNAFLSVFRDPHSYVLPLDYYQNVIANPRASASVLGIVLARNDEGYFIQKVIDESSAARAGLKRGDWVTSINGTELVGLAPQSLGDLLRSSDSPMKFRLLRAGKALTVSVTKLDVKIPSVAWKPLPGNNSVAVLTLHKFAQGSCRDMNQALFEIKTLGFRGLLLDLRDNSGGQMDEAACMVSLFLGPEKVAFRIRYLDPNRDSEIHYGSESQVWSEKMAVLINSGTASAAEILAGSLRDHNRAVLVGERSFGKGSFQEGEVWKRNSRLAFFQTKGFYYLPSGYSPQMKGIAPDVSVAFRKSVLLREQDQYMNPLLSPSEVAEPVLGALDLSSCNRGPGRFEDPQMKSAETALLCDTLIGSGGRSASVE